MILVIEENGLPAIAVQNGVKEWSQIVEAWLLRHAFVFHQELRYGKPDPLPCPLRF